MKNIMLIVFLVITIILSAIGVVYTKHDSRKIFVELNELYKIRDKLNVTWGQLQIEQSTWATHGRIEQVAQKTLMMKLPDYKNVIFIKKNETK